MKYRPEDLIVFWYLLLFCIKLLTKGKLLNILNYLKNKYPITSNKYDVLKNTPVYVKLSKHNLCYS